MLARCARRASALKFRLVRAAESLDAVVLLAVRGLERIKQLEQQLTAGSSESTPPMPPDPPIAPVIVGDVDVAPLAPALRILQIVERETNAAGDSSASEMMASLRVAQRMVQEVFADLQAASTKSAP